MLKNYFKIALRVLRRAKVYSVVNVVGLALGFAGAILIGLWVQNELSYDSYNKNADRIYRVTSHFKIGDFTQTNATSAPPIAGTLRSFPSVQAATSFYIKNGPIVVRNNGRVFIEDKLAYADHAFFSVFSLKLIEGNPATALASPKTIIITKSLANLLFPGTDPIGKVVSVNSGSNDEMFEVTGVMEDIPGNSTFHFKMMASMSTFWSDNPGYANQWFFNTFYNYFVLRPNASIEAVSRQLSAASEQNLGKTFVRQYSWGIGAQRLTDIHLHSHLSMEIEPNGNVRTLMIFLAVGLFILFIAIVNFVSLSTARYSDRAKEIGIRKVVDADRKRLVFQFMSEAVVLTFISSIIAVSFAEIALPYFNTLTDRSLSINIGGLGIIFAGSILVGVLAGSYPAFYLSSFKTNRILRKETVLGRGGVVFRKGLVVAQFALAIIVMIATIVVARQLSYVESRSLGFNKNQVIVVPLYYQSIAGDYPSFRNELMNTAGVVDVSGSWGEFGSVEWKNEIKYQGRLLFKANWLGVDYNFIKTMEIPVVSGREFSDGVATDSSGTIIVNEAAAGKLRGLGLFDKPLSPGIQNVGAASLHVIGVVKDFNYLPMYYPLKPFFFVLMPKRTSYVYVRIASHDMTKTLAGIRSAWDKIAPQFPFEYHFLDEQLDQSYRNDRKLGDVFGIAAFLSIFISSLGLFGLANHTVERRTKEVGIRKALGASTSDIMTLLTKEFAGLVLLANLIAWPIAYYFMNKWLQDFAFRIGIGLIPFLLASLTAFLISMLTVSSHALRAATANPVESLRHE